MPIAKNTWILVVFIVCGLVIGSVLNTLLSGRVPHFFTESVQVGIDPPMYLDLNFFKMEFGFLFELNLLGIIGLLLSVLLFRKL
ncbi:MAG: hypothetical protein AUJ92_11790 [Armatimonadetes bacterium CG2_30_59_28]|nr:DUF4321 domain-containing protein [Armatimonadota bacterium]OIO93715.1 MAG: hypothetical protein AUJ92_11790 [Armatimonadetes bacterium CG2_30_59_28]PIU60807.1 MAG: hypothetical protein COS85_22590 [Armatimonadetes bacterium CG07_land_8_20_14_0_80_59_28]PIX44590.1 MAG: hypothetical protein COZ56_04165 [Armatimonadetes bacterium CG_4_8_14_3_um_filter_58_9]PIY44244.1 MAG: hypothetical protein COZ05_08740 [Armatimonadetes bacterium CG_4_10_14_3_um_filter_59_10]